MKKLILLFSLSFGMILSAQSFDDIRDVIKFMENKTYYDSSKNLELQYGYISLYNTYGITLKSNISGRTMYFINCDVNGYEDFADISGMNPEDGLNFAIRLYRNKIIIGPGESKQSVMYPSTSKIESSRNRTNLQNNTKKEKGKYPWCKDNPNGYGCTKK